MNTRKNTVAAGLGTLGLLLVLIIVGALVGIAFRLVPIYIDYFTIVGALKGLKDDPQSAQMSPPELRRSIQDRLYINNVTSVGYDDFKIRKDRNQTIIQVVYEVRRPLVGNLDVVAKFDESVTLP